MPRRADEVGLASGSGRKLAQAVLPLTYSPDWFTTTQWDAFDTGRLASSFGSDFSSAISSESTSPGSSSGFSDGDGRR
ncbi:MAG TPA: hypothetical protein VFB04_04915 [Terriglobales bacterium]|nr:hypothetical protein [Terriglobales bacterium]